MTSLSQRDEARLENRDVPSLWGVAHGDGVGMYGSHARTRTRKRACGQ